MLKKAKGFKWGRKSKIKLAKTAILKAGVYAYRDRRNKKREKRRLWQIKLNAALKAAGLSYNIFVHKLKQAKIELDRKILADLAENNPEIFKKLLTSLS